MSENSYNEENTIDVDFEITSEVDVQVGTVYQGTSIDDNVISTNKTWSSKKISDELALKADSSDLATVATTGSFDDLIDKPDAGDISYDNTSSGLTATDVQSAIDEVVAGGGGGATALSGLSDVSIPSSSLGTNQVLMYDGGTGKWENHAISMSGGGGSGNVSDVHANAPSGNEVLMWSSTYSDWENKPIVAGNDTDGVGNIKDIAIDELTLTEHQVLVYNLDDSVWENGTLSLGHTNVTSDFDDVYLTQIIANKDILIYDSTNNRWANGQLYKEVSGTLTAGSTSITLQEASITSNSTIDIYTADGTEWNSITVTTGAITITFDAQSSNLDIKVRIS